eukprot:COSAG04_NODE_2033_length_4964_cov_102.344913_4_plen_212_part_00
MERHLQVSELEVEVTVGREDFAAACAEQPERTAKLHAALLLTTAPELKEKADAAVLDAKIAAVWRWADVVEDGNLGATELERLADRVGLGIKELCDLLGLRPRAVLGGRAGTVIDRREEDGVEKIQVRWEDDGAESEEIKVSDLDEPLAGGWADPEVSIGRDAFAAACRAHELHKPGTVGQWFQKLRLVLKAPAEERSCLDKLCRCLRCGM